MPTQWTAFQLGTRAALLSAVLSLFAIPGNAQQNGVATGRSGGDQLPETKAAATNAPAKPAPRRWYSLPRRRTTPVISTQPAPQAPAFGCGSSAASERRTTPQDPAAGLQPPATAAGQPAPNPQQDPPGPAKRTPHPVRPRSPTLRLGPWDQRHRQDPGCPACSLRPAPATAGSCYSTNAARIKVPSQKSHFNSQIHSGSNMQNLAVRT